MTPTLNARLKALAEEGAALRDRLRQIGAEMMDCAAAARVFGVTLTVPEGVNLQDRMTVRDIVMRRLTEAGPDGLTSTDLNKELKHLHPKTVGMTLYRLSKENFCKRVGSRLWVKQ